MDTDGWWSFLTSVVLYMKSHAPRVVLRIRVSNTWMKSSNTMSEILNTRPVGKCVEDFTSCVWWFHECVWHPYPQHNEWSMRFLICTINWGPNLLCWDPQCCVGAHSVVLELNTRCAACVETQHISLHFNQCVGLNLQVKCLGRHYCVMT